METRTSAEPNSWTELSGKTLKDLNRTTTKKNTHRITGDGRESSEWTSYVPLRGTHKETRMVEVLCELREGTQFSPWDKQKVSLRFFFFFYLLCLANSSMTRKDSINSGVHPLSVWITKQNHWVLISLTVGFDVCGRWWVEKFGIRTNKSDIWTKRTWK